jgi:molybdopterin-binding protein
MLHIMPQMRIRDAAFYLGVSDDTVRRWIDNGVLSATSDASGRKVVDGYEVATVARQHAQPTPVGELAISARNKLAGLVTDIRVDTVMAQVEMQCGPYRVVSLMSREAADELGLEPGVSAIASVKSTNVVVEVPEAGS